MTDEAQDASVWGWDPTPGIVSLRASRDGRVLVWRRIPETGILDRKSVV